MSKCTACEHPVNIPGALRDTVMEIHTCDKAAHPENDPDGLALVQAIHDRKARETPPRQVNPKYIENRKRPF